MPSAVPPPLSLRASVPTGFDFTVVGLAEASGSPVFVGATEDMTKKYEARFGSSALALAQSLGARAKPGSVAVMPGLDGRIIVVGLGDADVTPEQARRAAANGVRKALEVAGVGSVRVAISLETLEPEVLQAAAEGALMASYRYAKPGTPEAAATASEIVLIGDPRTGKATLEYARVVASAVCRARDWVNTPANTLYPETFADEARALGREQRVSVEVLDESALTKGGFGGILAVGGGSARPPRLAKVTWAPRGAKTHLALVGKGITFDSGGLDLKTADGMYTMKCDMAGAAAVLAAVAAIAELGLKVKVTAFAAMAENMPSGTAFRPSDVLVMHSGKTVENANSDAEGRLVLADALSLAGQGSPDLIVDVATLTGACVVALGSNTAGLMASDDKTADALLDAAEAAGEPFWQLPITEECADSLQSEVADLKSSGSRHGGALVAAAFLREFVPVGVPWAHLDIAGPAWTDKARDYFTIGGTGAGVRTLVALARSLAS